MKTMALLLDKVWTMFVNEKDREEKRKGEVRREKRERVESFSTCKSHRDSKTQNHWVLCNTLR